MSGGAQGTRRDPGGAVRLSLSLSLVLVAACSDPAPRWIHLAGLEVARHERGEAELGAAAKPGMRLVTQGDELWMEGELERSEWLSKQPGAWKARFPVLGDAVLQPDSMALTSEERTFTAHRRGGFNDEHPSGTYGFANGLILLKLDEGEEPPARSLIRVRVAHRSPRSGEVAGRRFSGEGLTVWSGERDELESAVPAASVLRVATVVEPVLTRSSDECRFRIELDGVALLDHEQEVVRGGSVVWHELPLPAAGLRSARFAFEVSGPIAKTAFLAPVIGPAAVSEPDPRPDLLLFVADTFRADNLATYGGRAGLTPELDALARESLTFLQARSASTYTLPSHAALFTGLYPHQTSADGLEWALPDAIDTVAERLRHHGYRTGAVTDAVVVSRAFGLHQGFESWDEQRSDLESTLARVRAFLESGDGRPTFLFVQTYRVHSDYHVTPETRARLERELGLEIGADWDACYAPLQQLMERSASAAEARDLVPPFRNLYLGGVADLDAWFGRFRAEPSVARLLERGVLVFTSDHGEAFLEHENILHGGEVYDELIRVPLLVHGPAIIPRAIEHPVSLVDVLPTLADLAGLPTEPGWQGSSLLAPLRDRTVFSFSCAGERTSAAIIQGPRKLIASADTGSRTFLAPSVAFDLAEDPRETTDLAAGGTDWAAELFGRLEQHAELLRPLEAGVRASLDEEQVDDLRELGYAGDEE